MQLVEVCESLGGWQGWRRMVSVVWFLYPWHTRCTNGRYCSRRIEQPRCKSAGSLNATKSGVESAICPGVGGHRSVVALGPDRCPEAYSKTAALSSVTVSAQKCNVEHRGSPSNGRSSGMMDECSQDDESRICISLVCIEWSSNETCR